MIDSALALTIAVIGGLIGAWSTYFFGLRADKEARRRESVVAHLIEAYRNLENAARRSSLTDDQKDRLETSVAAIFLLGSKEAAEEARQFAKGFESGNGNGDITSLLKVMRNDLREELGSDRHDVDALFLRMDREEK